MHRGRAGRVVAAVLAAVVLAGCTSATDPDEPGPTATPSASEAVTSEEAGDPVDRVAVIIPPAGVVASAEAADLGRAADEFAADPPPGVADVRVARASTPAFVRDLANLAVDDGYDVVCIVGTGTAELALELARARRDTQICTTDGRIGGGPVNLVAVALDPADLIEAGAVAIGTAEAPVGLFASQQVGDVEELTAAFTEAVAPPRQPVAPSPTATPGATDGEPGAGPASPTDSPSPAAEPDRSPFVTATPGAGTTSQVNAAEELAAEAPSRALVLATPDGSDVALAAGASGAELVVVADWAVDREGELPPNVLVTLTVDWGALLRGAIDAARTPEAAQVQLWGIDAELLGAVPGGVPEAEDAAGRTTEHLRRSVED